MDFADFENLLDKRAQAMDAGDMVQYWLYDALICYELDYSEIALKSLQRAQESVKTTD
jgi:hypothetical protein